jgi:hypothetical protein
MCRRAIRFLVRVVFPGAIGGVGFGSASRRARDIRAVEPAETRERAIDRSIAAAETERRDVGIVRTREHGLCGRSKDRKWGLRRSLATTLDS